MEKEPLDNNKHRVYRGRGIYPKRRSKTAEVHGFTCFREFISLKIA